MCPFCEIDKSLILDVSSFSYLLANLYPLGAFSLLVVPKRHSTSITSLTPEESHDLMNLAIGACCKLKQNAQLEGLNMLMNEGEIAGQTIPHLHVHVVARRLNDQLQNLRRTNEKTAITTNQLAMIKTLF